MSHDVITHVTRSRAAARASAPRPHTERTTSLPTGLCGDLSAQTLAAISREAVTPAPVARVARRVRESVALLWFLRAWSRDPRSYDATVRSFETRERVGFTQHAAPVADGLA